MNLTAFTASLRRHGALALAALSFGSGLTMLSVSPASAAAVIHVTTTVDDYEENGNCTLREAIGAHNFQKAVDACEAGNGPSTIEVPAGIYNLTVGEFSEPRIQYGNLNIFKDRPALIINGAGMGQTVIDAGSKYAIFEVASSLTVSNMTLKNAAVSGAINVTREAVGVDHVAFENNEPNAINGSSGLQIGIVGSRFSGTKGVAIWARGPFDMYNSTVYGNGAPDVTGPGLVAENSVANIVNSTFTNNTGSPVSAIWAKTNTQMSIDSSTIAQNIETSGQLFAVSSANGSTVTIRRSILDAPCEGTNFVDGGHNVSAVASSCVTAAKSKIVGSLGLAGLADNGGATPTMALQAGSPALGAVPVGCSADDQRGQARPAVCDAGAYEADPSVPETTTTTPTTTTSTTTTIVIGPGIEPNQEPEGEPGKGPEGNGGNGGNGQKDPANAPQPTAPSASIPPATIPPATYEIPSSTPASSDGSTPTALPASAPATVPVAESGELASGKSVLVLGEALVNPNIPEGAPAVASPVDLAYTGGSNSTPMTAVAVGLMALGVVIVAASRRRSAR